MKYFIFETPDTKELSNWQQVRILSRSVKHSQKNRDWNCENTSRISIFVSFECSYFVQKNPRYNRYWEPSRILKHSMKHIQNRGKGANDELELGNTSRISIFVSSFNIFMFCLTAPKTKSNWPPSRVLNHCVKHMHRIIVSWTGILRLLIPSPAPQWTATSVWAGLLRRDQTLKGSRDQRSTFKLQRSTFKLQATKIRGQLTIDVSVRDETLLGVVEFGVQTWVEIKDLTKLLRFNILLFPQWDEDDRSQECLMVYLRVVKHNTKKDATKNNIQAHSRLISKGRGMLQDRSSKKERDK